MRSGRTTRWRSGRPWPAAEPGGRAPPATFHARALPVPESATFEKEMAIERHEFMRTLGRALPEARIDVDGDTITVQDEGGTLEITLSPERVRRIASLALPVITARFRYVDHADPAGHLARLERSFQRGGG